MTPRAPRWWLLPAAWIGMGAVQFLAGLLSAWRIAATPPDMALRDTYYVVAHWHYGVSLAAMILIFAAVYAALGWWGVAYRRSLAWAHLVLTTVGLSLIFFPQFLLGVADPVSRFTDVQESFAGLNAISSVGYLIGLAGLAFFALLLVELAVWRMRRPRP